MDVETLEAWLERYFRAWESNIAEDVAALFTDEASYSYGPFRQVAHGREQIVSNWVAGGTPAGFISSWQALAVNGDRGVAHWRVSFDQGPGTRMAMDGILVVTLVADGRCVDHQEWYSTHLEEHADGQDR